MLKKFGNHFFMRHFIRAALPAFCSNLFGYADNVSHQKSFLWSLFGIVHCCCLPTKWISTSIRAALRRDNCVYIIQKKRISNNELYLINHYALTFKAFSSIQVIISQSEGIANFFLNLYLLCCTALTVTNV